MNEFQINIDKCLQDILNRDQTAYLATGFNALFTTHLPNIIKNYGTVTTLHNNLKYTLCVSDLITHNAPTTNSDCLDFSITQSVVATAKITLSVVLVKLVGSQFITLKDPSIMSEVRTTIFKLPINAGRNLLYTSAFDDPNFENQWLPTGTIICHGKLRCLPPVKLMGNNKMLLTRTKDYSKLQLRSAHHSKPFRCTSTLDFVIMNANKKSSSEGVIGCCLPYSDQTLHVGVLAQAFGCPPHVFISLMKALMGPLYDPIVFSPYEISLQCDKSVLDATNQEVATVMISKLFGKSRHSTGLNQLKTEVFPHLNIGFEEGNLEDLHRAKLLLLTRCTGLVILLAAGLIDDTPRDFIRYASIMTPAHYIGTLVRKLFITHMRTRQKLLRRALDERFKKPPEKQTYIDLSKLFGEVKLSSRIVSPIANGAWGPTKKGVTISLHSGNPDGFRSELTKFSSSLEQTGASNTNARQVQMDGFGDICGSSSPDGKKVGLTMQLALLSTITIDFEQPKILADLLELLLQDILIPVNAIIGNSLDEAFIESSSSFASLLLNKQKSSKIEFAQLKSDCFFSYFNNCGIHSHFIASKNIDLFISKFRFLRRRGNIPQFTFLEKYELRREIHVMNMGGQIIRPLLVVENMSKMHKDMGMTEMLSLGIIEYVNVAEDQTICFVANSYSDYLHCLANSQNQDQQIITHIDLVQAVFASHQVASVPFLTSQHGPRTAYYAQQIKQRITADIKRQWGAVFNTQLYYAHRSLVCSDICRKLQQYSRGSGYQTMKMAFYAENNEDDSLIFSKAACERGLGNAFATRYYCSDASPAQTSNRKTKIVREQFIKPENVISQRESNFSTVGSNGIPTKNTFIAGGGIAYAKTKTTRRKITSHLGGGNNAHDSNVQTAIAGKSTIETRDVSGSTKKDESGYVGDVKIRSTPNGIKVTVPIEITYNPMVGDKFTTRFSGKGVISELQYQHDMIYSIETGQSPDIIVPPPSVTSRMTVSALLEAFTGKHVAITGDLNSGVDFQNFEIGNESKIDELGVLMTQHGFTSDGFETYASGKTGKLLNIRIFTGIVDVARLVHLASKKLHTRDFGPRDPFTRQPKIGRLNSGGLKVGEMEKDVLCSHGAAHILECRNKHLSDPFFVYICSKCKLLADGCAELDLNYTWCRGCRSKKYTYLVSIPFTFLVAITELHAMGIVVRIAVTPDDLSLKKKQPAWCDDTWLNLFEEDEDKDVDSNHSDDQDDDDEE